MLREDSNGDTFEIIDKKSDETLNLVDKTESLSSISSSASFLPSPGVSVSSIPSPSGNLLSNVTPPSALPSFVPTPNFNRSHNIPQSQMPPAAAPPVMSPPTVTNNPPTSEPYYPTQFSAAIPPSKGVQHGATNLETISTNDDSGGFIGWMKGAVSSGGLLSKVAERAKNSVDSMITTLDPQMREYIYSGGDLDVVVASGQEVKVSAIREAFQAVFGKATVSGKSVQATSIAAQPVGFKSALKSAEERIQAVLNGMNVQTVPIVAVENFLLEVEDEWYDLGIILLKDPARQISLKTFTQMTPVPSVVVALAQEDTPKDYPLKESGYSITIGNLMAKNLGVGHAEWHHTLTGVSRRDMILLAAKSLALLYKNSITQ